MDEQQQQRFHPPVIPQTNGNESIVEVLRREADQAEATAKRLRELANALESGSGTFLSENCSLALPPYETAPLDENGVPKYKGKKRGRKPKKRLRKRNPNAKKRAHTAYTLFVQETYPKIKQQNEPPPGNDGDPNQFRSKNIISLVAKQWKDIPPNEKEEWKRRAKEMSEQLEESEDEGDHEHVHVHEHDNADLGVHHATADDVVVGQLTNDHGVVGHEHEHEHEMGEHGHGHGHDNLQGEVGAASPAQVAMVHHHDGVHDGHDEVVGDEGYYKGGVGVEGAMQI